MYLNETIEQLKRIEKINEKEYNTICIIGLEKAGKSSFINALLGFELLPFK
jgi:ribosome biogenesis GTPase A